MNCQPIVTDYQLHNHTRTALADDLHGRLEGARLDSDRDTVILADIGAHALERWLPGGVITALRNYRVGAAMALTLSNLPLQSCPPTPVNGFGDEIELGMTNAIHLGLVKILGLTPFAVPYENSGRLIRNVVPNPAAAGTTSSWGADKEFFWHTDNPHLRFGEVGMDPRCFPPRYLTFYAIRNVEGVPTSLAPLDPILAGLQGAQAALLSSGLFSVEAPTSNDPGTDGRRASYTEASIIERKVDAYWVRYDRGTTTAMTKEADCALRAWNDALDQVTPTDLVMQPGQFLVFDNYRLLHRRAAFTPEGNGRSRWLRRCYAS